MAGNACTRPPLPFCFFFFWVFLFILSSPWCHLLPGDVGDVADEGLVDVECVQAVVSLVPWIERQTHIFLPLMGRLHSTYFTQSYGVPFRMGSNGVRDLFFITYSSETAHLFVVRNFRLCLSLWFRTSFARNRYTTARRMNWTQPRTPTTSSSDSCGRRVSEIAIQMANNIQCFIIK